MKQQRIQFESRNNLNKHTHTYQVNVSWEDCVVKIGGGAPIVIQSMTDTPTENSFETALQIKKLAEAGAELVRISVNTKEAAKSVPFIRESLDKMKVYTPIVGDFHFNGHKLLKEFPECASSLSKYRINPGNIGNQHTTDKNFSEIIEIACKYDKPIRIGANWGSIQQSILKKINIDNFNKQKNNSSQDNVEQALIESVLNSANRAEELGMKKNSIILSCKTSRVRNLINVYKNLSKQCKYPLHIGLTEAGMGINGIVSSSSALGILIYLGIGDTIRVSVTPSVNEDRINEVIIAKAILQSMDIKAFYPSIASCPGCGRTSSDYFRNLTQQIQLFVKEKMNIWRVSYPGVENLKIAVMGCIVNGPGESQHADIGISLPGSGEITAAPVFIDGVRTFTLKGKNIGQEFEKIIENYISERYGRGE